MSDNASGGLKMNFWEFLDRNMSSVVFVTIYGGAIVLLWHILGAP